MTTYEVTCSQCKQVKYPTLLDRPVDYVCTLCTMVTPRKIAARKAAADKRKKPS